MASTLLTVCCKRHPQDEEKALPAPPPSTSQASTPATPTLPPELQAKSATPEPDPEEDEPLVVGPPQPPKWDGPFLVVTQTSAGVYAEPRVDRKKKLGYVSNGAKIAVKKETVSNEDCKTGWHEVVTGGFICGGVGTLDPKDPKLKFVQKQPVLDEVLPYTYARNAKNGTPLYKSVPTPEQMYGYEPYLEAAKKWREKKAREQAARAAELAAEAAAKAAKMAEESNSDDETSKVKPASTRKSEAEEDPPKEGDESSDGERQEHAAADDSGERKEEEATPEEAGTPWWQRDPEEAKLHEVTLEDLQNEADDVLAMRMMKGFYVAIDRTFRWNERLWYKTTKGLVAPADRFWQVAGSKFQGVELDGEKYSLPVGFVYGSRKTATLYELDSDDKLKPEGSIERMAAVNLTGQQRKIGKNNYFETSEKLWIKEHEIRVAQAVDPEEAIGPKERWIDINVTTQTLVAYVGKKPVYATMISSGKESTIKDKDHRTPRGEWRIREKHVATTMDGNGTAAGDLPYSIEDVPFVAYFHRSYAVHAAFWHRNYGVRMSHGCVNLTPVDSAWLFEWTDPKVPPDWHGANATEGEPGTVVYVRR